MVVSSELGTPRSERTDAADLPADGSAKRRGLTWLLAASLGVLGIPLVVALVGFRREPWTPVLDLAMTELRVRDVGGRHTPLIGLPGRIGPLEEQGSHPGPLSFYALAPTYRLLGSTAWALQVATVLVHLAAMGVALWIGSRRAGRTGVVAVGLGLAVLTATYGGGTLSEPWNPYLPLLWWVVVLLAAWSVLLGDLPMLPVAVLAASFCAQTHIPYLVLTLGVGGLAVGGAVLAARTSPGARRSSVRWMVASGALGVALWLPPTIDQVRHDPGNYAALIKHFSSPDEEVEGVRGGVTWTLQYLDVAHVARGIATDPGWGVVRSDENQPSPWRGAVVLLAWAASAALAWRRSLGRALASLHLVAGSALVLMVLSISRIFGEVWYYLRLWGWAVGLLAVSATVATAVALVRAERPARPRAARSRPPGVVVAVLGLAVVARFAVDAWDSPHADGPVAEQLAAAIDDVEAGLERGEGLADGRDGRYLITWSDALHIGSQGYGLLNELERRGFEVGLEPARRVPATSHRVLAPEQATARIHLATGSFVERWQAVPGAVELAYVDERTPAERAERDALAADVVARLESLGLEELAVQLEANLFGTAIDERIPEDLRIDLGRLLEIGEPMAVFVAPVDAPPL
ncbi:MAG: hypothetical protein ACLGI8_13415 [Acidimicrobiia bacterium]